MATESALSEATVKAVLAQIDTDIAATDQKKASLVNLRDNLSSLYGLNGAAAPAAVNGSSDGRQKKLGLGEFPRVILAQLENGAIGIAVLEKAIKQPRHTVKRELKALIADGRVKVEGSGKHTKYRRA